MSDPFNNTLQRQNIWWAGRIEDDVHLRQWKEQPRHWAPLQLNEVPLEPFSLNIIIGPRQVGKTTLIKFLVEKLLQQKTPPAQILYARCDEFVSPTQLRGVIEEFLHHASASPFFLFLDEITDVPGWEKTIKGFIDDGAFRHAVVTITGSNAFQLQKGSELFPGRRGHGRDIMVLPLSFREFLSVADPTLFSRIPPLPGLHDLHSMEALAPLQPALHRHLLDYFVCGGFPLAILSFLQARRVSEQAREAYRSWVVGDLLKSGKSDMLAREILKVIISKAPSPVSWEAIAQETSIKSPPTIASYIELLERLFVVLPLYSINPDTGTREFAKNKKLHLLDPFLWHLFEEWCLQELRSPHELLAEAALASHLARHSMKGRSLRHLNDHVSYWKNSHEIDVIVHLHEGLLGFEMKWTDNASGFRFRAGPVKNLVYVSRNTLRMEKPAVVPLALLLARL